MVRPLRELLQRPRDRKQRQGLEQLFVPAFEKGQRNPFEMPSEVDFPAVELLSEVAFRILPGGDQPEGLPIRNETRIRRTLRAGDPVVDVDGVRDGYGALVTVVDTFVDAEPGALPQALRDGHLQWGASPQFGRVGAIRRGHRLQNILCIVLAPSERLLVPGLQVRDRGPGRETFDRIAHLHVGEQRGVASA